MNHPGDTIAAISTPVGQGGIGIVRMSGPEALAIAGRVFSPDDKTKRLSGARSFSVTYGHVVHPASRKEIDEVLVTVMRAPRSYTREDVVEMNCHGGMVAVRRVLDLLLAEGACLAEPGEFTKRAFLNGRISLAQAEAVMDLISARTEESMKIAAEQLRGGLSEELGRLREALIEICAHAEALIDFPEEEIETKTSSGMIEGIREIKTGLDRLSKTFEEARFFREGLSVAIVGRPNVGKSSLLNALLKKDRAIVTEVPGTTRDTIEECLNLQGLPVRIVDTAGIRNSAEAVEREGIRRSLDALDAADYAIAVLDGSEPLHEEDREILERIKEKGGIIAINKSDLTQQLSAEAAPFHGRACMRISALRGEGIEELKSAIVRSNLRDWKEEREGVVVTNIRHKRALDLAAAALERAAAILSEERPLEISAIELREAADRIGEIIGAVTTDDILNRIFDDFCIGK
jgi:tRNA modification GTPase